MQGNFTNLLASAVAPAVLGSSSNVLSVFAAGALSGAGATLAVNELRLRLTKQSASVSFCAGNFQATFLPMSLIPGGKDLFVCSEVKAG